MIKEATDIGFEYLLVILLFAWYFVPMNTYEKIIEERTGLKCSPDGLPVENMLNGSMIETIECSPVSMDYITWLLSNTFKYLMSLF